MSCLSAGASSGGHNYSPMTLIFFKRFPFMWAIELAAGHSIGKLINQL